MSATPGGEQDQPSVPGYDKPLPRRAGLTGQFYSFLARHELRFQRCSECRAWRHTPRWYCHDCGSDRWEWARSCGHGTVFTWSTTHRPLHPAFTAVPFAQVVVEMDEGPRLLTWVLDVAPEDLEIGMAVTVVFDNVAPGVALARFRVSQDGRARAGGERDDEARRAR